MVTETITAKDVFSIVEMDVAVVSGPPEALRMEMKPAYAIACQGRIFINQHSERPHWSYDRAELEKDLAHLVGEDR